MPPSERPAEDQGGTAIQFGRYRALPHTGQLFAGERPIAIGGRAFDLLMVLAEAQGAVVSKQEAMARVWPNLHVEDVNLRMQLASLRRLLAEDRDLITTVPGRGYALAGQVTTAAPAPKPATPKNTNLPEPGEPLIGRDDDLGAMAARLSSSRLVTVTGSGGVGKTRFAIEAGRHAADRFPAGVWLVDLAPVTDPALVASAVATALGVPLRTPEKAADALASAIAGRRMLLIFDNCEHLVDAASDLIQTLLTQAPDLTVIATSQETLRLSAEHVFRLRPLTLPPAEAVEIAGFGAVDLFLIRARAVDPRLALDPENTPEIAQICRSLDGVPLALEMAAAQLPLLGLAGLRAGLDDRLALLAKRDEGGPFDARQRTLRAMMTWSHGLLAPEEQEMFRRLGVFSGSFSLDAAVAVAGPGRDRWDMLDTLGRLIDKSLVTVDGAELPRYRLLETLRLYALEQLETSGERAEIATRHARFFQSLFDHADAIWETTPDKDWLLRYKPEIDHVRAALDWALADPARAPVAISLGGTALHLLDRLVLYTEGRRYADRAVDLIDAAVPSVASFRLLRRAAALWFNTDRVPRPRPRRAGWPTASGRSATEPIWQRF